MQTGDMRTCPLPLTFEKGLATQKPRLDKSSYGFILDRNQDRYFFHFGSVLSNPEIIRPGDAVEFVIGKDRKTDRIHAQQVRRLRDPSVARSKSVRQLRSLATSWDSRIMQNPLFKMSSSGQSSSEESTSAEIQTRSPLAVEEQFKRRGFIINLPTQEETGRLLVSVGNNWQNIVPFTWDSLKYPAEMSLCQPSVEVEFQMIVENDQILVARNVVPLVPHVLAVVVFVTTVSVTFRCMKSSREFTISREESCLPEEAEMGSIVKMVILELPNSAPVITRCTIACDFNKLVDFGICSGRVLSLPDSSSENSLGTIISDSAEGPSLFSFRLKDLLFAHSLFQDDRVVFYQMLDPQEVSLSLYATGIQCIYDERFDAELPRVCKYVFDLCYDYALCSGSPNDPPVVFSRAEFIGDYDMLKNGDCVALSVKEEEVLQGLRVRLWPDVDSESLLYNEVWIRGVLVKCPSTWCNRNCVVENRECGRIQFEKGGTIHIAQCHHSDLKKNVHRIFKGGDQVVFLLFKDWTHACYRAANVILEELNYSPQSSSGSSSNETYWNSLSSMTNEFSSYKAIMPNTRKENFWGLALHASRMIDAKEMSSRQEYRDVGFLQTLANARSAWNAASTKEQKS
ncbi:putative cold-shock DNA-binding domain protein [Trichinella spiralis]|uniref:putative cold-shock DNA-binding domain protein n=1 Tax=Trichinella spiralis TaxID=6334 RepID=UPI0001EFC4C0|nr:putative cold-shock DNA-binding domain protein [Trichinella spiralis]